MGDLPKYEALPLAYLLMVLSVISVVSSSIILYFYWRYRTMRTNFLSTLIFLLSLLDALCWLNIIITTSYYIDHSETPISQNAPAFCRFLGFFWNYCELLNFGVTLIICLALYMALMRNVDPARYKFLMINLVFTISFILSLIPLFIPVSSFGEENDSDDDSSYGPVDGHIKCWITNKTVRIIFFYIPLWIVCILNLIVIIKLLRGLHLRAFSELHDRYSTRFVMFPAIMMGCYLVSSIRRLAQLFSENEDITPFWFVVLMYVFMPLQGLFNTIVYGMFEEIIRVRIIAVFTCNWEALREMDRLEVENELVGNEEGGL